MVMTGGTWLEMPEERVKKVPLYVIKAYRVNTGTAELRIVLTPTLCGSDQSNPCSGHFIRLLI
jgi:hypothetical protein